MTPTRSYARLLRAAVRYFALGDLEELTTTERMLQHDSDALWDAMWRRDRSPLLVAGALMDAADRFDVALPEVWRQRCLDLLLAGARRYALLEDATRSLTTALSCPVVRLKGMWLTEFVYPRVRQYPTRLFADIDVFIPPERLAEAHRFLTATHSEPQFHPEPWEYVYRIESQTPTWQGLPMLEDAKPVAPELLAWGQRSIFVEIHTGSLDLLRFVPKPFLIKHERDTAAHTVHLCLHLLTHTFRHPYGYVDVALALRHPSFDAKRFLTLAHEYRLEPLCAAVFGVVTRCFGEDIVPASFRALTHHALYRRALVLAPETAAVEPIPTLWLGTRFAWRVSPTWRGRAFVVSVASQAVVNALVPPDTRFRRWIRPLKRRWLSRRKANLI